MVTVAFREEARALPGKELFHRVYLDWREKPGCADWCDLSMKFYTIYMSALFETVDESTPDVNDGFGINSGRIIENLKSFFIEVYEWTLGVADVRSDAQGIVLVLLIVCLAVNFVLIQVAWRIFGSSITSPPRKVLNLHSHRHTGHK